MTEISNTKHSARVDDALAAEIDAEEELELPVDEPATPLPGPLSEDERVRRSELAMALRPGAFPADRGVLLQVARSGQASEEILALLQRLPIDTRFDTVQEVWEAVGGHREARDPVIEDAPEVASAAQAPVVERRPGGGVPTLVLGVLLEGFDVALSAVRTLVRTAGRTVHIGR